MKKLVWYLVIVGACTALFTVLINEFIAPEWAVPVGFAAGHVSGLAAFGIAWGKKGKSPDYVDRLPHVGNRGP